MFKISSSPNHRKYKPFSLSKLASIGRSISAVQKKKWETVQLEKISNLSFFSPEYKTVFLVPSDERPVFAILAQGRVVDNTKQPFLECQFILHARNVQR